MKARLRELLQGLLLAGASVLATLLLIELGLRAAGYVPARYAMPADVYSPHKKVFLDCYASNPRGYFDLDLRDPATQERYRAEGVRGIELVATRAPYAVELRFNSLHFRDAELGPKPEGVQRVMVLGDSFTEGQGVKEADTYVRRLERRLNEKGGARVEVRNCGRRAADFPILRKMFEKVLPFQPDVLVYAMVPNDGERTEEFEKRQSYVNDWIVDRRRWLRPGATAVRPWEPRLFAFVRDRWEAWRIGRETSRWYLGMYGEENREGWEATQNHLRGMRDELRARGARFLVASWPLLLNLEGDDPFASVAVTLDRFCKQEGIARLDLRPALRGRPTESLWVHPIDRHPNEVAHALAAEALAPAVKKLLEAR